MSTGDTTQPGPSAPELRTATAVILLLLVALPLFLVNLGGRDLWAPDEPRFAQIGREMVRSGNWIVPRMNGLDVALLPPMTYWLVALPSALRGDVNEFTARVLIAGTALAGALATFFLGRRMYGCRVGLLSAVVLVTSFKYLWQARWLQADMPLAAFVTLALLFFYCGLTSERRKGACYHLFCVFMALGVLSKGPLGVVLPGLVIVPYLTLTRSWGRVREMRIPTGAALFVLIVVPWYIAVGLSGGRSFLYEVVVRHNFGMFFKTWSHKEPVYFYLPHIFWLMMPWALFLFPALGHVIAQKENRGPKVFLLSWLVVQFLFFTASDAKQEKYLLPLLPAAAIVIGKGWADFIAGTMGARSRKAMLAICVATLAALVLAGLAGPVAPAVLVALGKYTPEMATLTAISLPLASILVLAAAPLFFTLRGELGRAFASLVILSMAAFLYAHGVAMDRFDSFKSARTFCKDTVEQMGPDEPLGIFGVPYRQTGAYVFYTDRPLVLFETGRDLVFEEKKEQFDTKRLKEFLDSPNRALCIVCDDMIPLLRESMKFEILLTEDVGHRRMHLISNGNPPQKGPPKA